MSDGAHFSALYHRPYLLTETSFLNHAVSLQRKGKISYHSYNAVAEYQEKMTATDVIIRCNAFVSCRSKLKKGFLN
jgi:hypothetical protein